MYRLKTYTMSTAMVAVTVTVLVLARSYVNTTTVALSMVLVIMFCALWWRSGPGLWAAFLEVLCFNFFFMTPYGSFAIDPKNWAEYVAFTMTALIMGQLSGRAGDRAAQAEIRRIEIESLYLQLRQVTEEAAEAELLRRSEKLKGALLDAVTHDLKTPLTSIKAAVTALLSEVQESDEYLHDLLQVIDEESDRLNRFIQGMMDLARFEGPDLLLKQSVSSVSEIIEIAVERAEPILGDRKLEIDLPEELLELLVDANAISQALYSILENAVKYSGRHTLIRLTALRESASFARIDVEDQGPGIPEEFRTKIFEKFFRLQTTSGTQPGFGLGLSIAKDIVYAHGGQIWVENVSGKSGARISFSVPIKPLAIDVASAL